MRHVKRGVGHPPQAKGVLKLVPAAISDSSSLVGSRDLKATQRAILGSKLTQRRREIALGGKRASRSRLEKDRSTRQSRHSVASTKYASPPKRQFQRA